MATPYIILAAQRTGSTWLRDVLDGHPEIAAYDELFLEGKGGFPGEEFGPTDTERFEGWFRSHRSRPGHLARARGAGEYLSAFFDRPSELRAVGFKLMYTQVRRNPGAAAWIARNRVRVIHLVRQNVLDIVVSQATMLAREQAHAWEGDEIKDARVSLDPKATAARLNQLVWHRHAARLFLRAARLPVLELEYEDLVADPAGFGAAFRFLGADDRLRPSSSMQRINRAPKARLVENWPELRESLARTRFAPLVEE